MNLRRIYLDHPIYGPPYVYMDTNFVEELRSVLTRHKQDPLFYFETDLSWDCFLIKYSTQIIVVSTGAFGFCKRLPPR